MVFFAAKLLECLLSCLGGESPSPPNLKFFLLCSVDVMTQHWSLCCLREIVRSSPSLCAALCRSDFSYWESGDDSDCDYDTGSASTVCSTLDPVVMKSAGTGSNSNIFKSLSLSASALPSSISANGDIGIINHISSISKSSSSKNESKNKSQNRSYNSISKSNSTYNNRSDDNGGNSNNRLARVTRGLDLFVKSKCPINPASPFPSTSASALATENRRLVSKNSYAECKTENGENNGPKTKFESEPEKTEIVTQERAGRKVMSNLFTDSSKFLTAESSREYSALLHDIKTMYIDIGQ